MAARGNIARTSHTVIRRRQTASQRIGRRSQTVSARDQSEHAILPTTQAGRVSRCLHKWQEITSDPWYQIKWIQEPFQISPAVTSTKSVEVFQLMEEEVQRLLAKQAITVVSPCEDQFISRLYGSHRPVINLRPLNIFVQKQYFKMEGSGMVKDILQPGDWMCSLDLKDAYHLVPIAKEHCKFLRFVWNGQIFKFNCLPFGRTLQCSNIHEVVATSNGSSASTRCETDCVLGWYPFDAPVQGVPGTTGNHDGPAIAVTRIHSEFAEVQPGANSANSISELSSGDGSSFCQRRRSKGSVKCARTSYGVTRWRYATITIVGQNDSSIASGTVSPTLLPSTAAAQDPVIQKVRVIWHTGDPGSRSDTRLAVVAEPPKDRRDISQPTPDLIIETDASLTDWGAVCEGVRTRSLWSIQEQHLYINVLELKACMFAVQAFVKDRQNVHVHLKMDNTSALAYVSRISPSTWWRLPARCGTGVCTGCHPV